MSNFIHWPKRENGVLFQCFVWATLNTVLMQFNDAKFTTRIWLKFSVRPIDHVTEFPIFPWMQFDENRMLDGLLINYITKKIRENRQKKYQKFVITSCHMRQQMNREKVRVNRVMVSGHFFPLFCLANVIYFIVEEEENLSLHTRIFPVEQ